MAVESSTERELRVERERCTQRRIEAWELYCSVQREEELLARDGILVSGVEGQSKRRLSREEREIELGRLRELRQAAGREWLEAKEAEHEACVAHVDLLLRLGVREHEAAMVCVAERAERVEDAYVRLVAAAIEWDEARRAEGRVAQQMTKITLDVARDDTERAQIKHAAPDQVPVGVGSDGSVEYADRPEPGVFGHGGNAWRPGNDAFGVELVSLIRGGRSRLGGCPSERVASRIQKALNAPHS